MSEIEDFFHEVVRDLERLGIPYMVVGSMASSTHGFPRTTRDADIVITPTAAQLRELLQKDRPNVYADLHMAEEAMANRSMFNIIDFTRGAKVDFIALKNRPFDQVQFSRRVRAKVVGVEVWVATPEDTILAKLEWSKMGGSDRQYEDAMQVAAMQRASLDVGYLRQWGVELGVSELLDRVLEEVDLTGEPPPNEPPR